MNHLICQKCNKQYPLNTPIWRCKCGGLLDVYFKAKFPIKELKKRKKNMWKYREAIPVDKDENIISFDEGFTPLSPFILDGCEILLKHDYKFPTHSFKDRGSSVLISKVKELGVEEVVEDSSGNAGASIAAYAKKAGVACEIVVSKKASIEKIQNVELYSGRIHYVDGSRENVANRALKLAENIYYASHSWNPFFFQGTKTVAYEIAEQLGWSSPDIIVVPVGNGTLLLGLSIGFSDLLSAGIIDKLPKIVGVQSENCAPLFKAFTGQEFVGASKTMADGIAVAEPVRGEQILNAVLLSGGEILTVNEQEVTDSLSLLHKEGLGVEPTSAVAIAGTKKIVDKHKDKKIVCILTGSKMKKG